MKKLSFAGLILVSGSFFLGLAANAQSSSANIASINSDSPASYTADADKIVLAGLKEASTKMYNHFVSNYKNATDLKMRTVANSGTRIDFQLNGNKVGARYDAKGKWMYSTSTFPAEKLDAATRQRVENAYPGFLVGGFVIEVQVLDKTSQLIMIENPREWKRVRLVNDELSIYEEYTKQ